MVIQVINVNNVLIKEAKNNFPISLDFDGIESFPVTF